MYALLHTVVFASVLIASSTIENNPCPENCNPAPAGNCPDPEALKKQCGIRGTIIDACACCDSCAKLEGEACHGAYGLLEGRCKEELKCTVPLRYVESGALNITGSCKLPRTEGESCGGAYGDLGQCQDKDKDKDKNKLVCSVPYHEVDYDEIMQGANISGICVSKSTCLRDCNNKKENPKCGSDGRWYRNLCAWKKKKCFLSEEEQKIWDGPESSSTCETSCPEITVPEHAQVELSNGIRADSEATFSCDSGYVLSPPQARTLTCRSMQWQGTPPTCQIENSTATPSTEASDAELFLQNT